MKKLIIACIAILVSGDAAFAQNRYFVDADAAGNNSGASWAGAFTDLQSALALAQAGDEVWVAEGLYLPTQGAERNIAFQPASGLKLYGGFAGTESAVSERDWAQHPTVLSGDIGNPGDSTDNAYTVIFLEEPDINTLVDGFVIRDGNADYSSPAPARDRRRCGGGMYIMGENWEAYPEIRNCTFLHNTARGFGGGAVVNGAGSGSAGAVFTNCRFEENRSLASGGGLARLGGSWIERPKDLDACLFLHNTAGFQGAGFYFSDSERTDTLNIVDCDFIENNAQDWGGGAVLMVGRENPGSFVISGCRFIKNSANDGGAIKFFPPAFLYTGFVQFDDCDFIENKSINALANGPAVVFLDLINYDSAQQVFANSRFAENKGWTYVLRSAFQPDTCLLNNLLFKDEDANIILHISSQDYLYLGNSTFSGNKASSCVSTAILKKISCFNCLFEHNIASSGRLIHETDTDTLLLLNSAFVDNELQQSAINNSFDLTMQAFNCTFSGIHDYKKFFYTLKPSLISHCYFDSLDCNLLFPNVICGPGIITGGGPMFAAPDSGNYRLLPCSPLLDAGNNNVLAPGDSTDLDGLPRIRRAAVDIGPYETPAPALNADPATEPSCPGGASGAVAFTISDACPPFSYAWTSGNSSGNGASGLGAGNYSFTISDATGASLNATIAIPEGDPPPIIPFQQPVICGDTTGGSATAAMAGGAPPFQWLWQSGSTDSLLTGLAAGAYSVTVTDARGCTAPGAVQVTRTGNIDVSIQITEISCFGEADGAFTVLPENGKPPFVWDWEDGSNGPTLGPLGPGEYTGSITDALGCFIALLLPLDEPPPLQFDATVHNASGPLSADGSIALTSVGGGTMPYMFQWNNGVENDTLDAVPPGVYTLTLSDAHGCTLAKSFEVSWISNAGEARQRAGLNVYPNPAGNICTLYATLPAGRTAERIELCDFTGKRLHTISLPNPGNGFSLQISLHDLPAGPYLLMLYDNEGHITGRAVVQKK
ncbi:MAG: T9SS type A sorting domain-containing protein [Saprospiraceae bacterium]|nr:T9SS type A sorting domain-containing protein [Saprospiraceae bacterium]